MIGSLLTEVEGCGRTTQHTGMEKVGQEMDAE
jgi:hypothetical protein